MTPTATQTQQKFIPNFTPEQIAIKQLPGKPVQSQYSQGEQILFLLTDNRRWFADPYVAQKIEQMRIEPGEFFQVQKISKRRGNQALTEVEITPVEQPAQPEPKPAAQAQTSSATHLTRCYRDAVDIAAQAVEYARSKGLTLAPEFGDIRALAATICISENGRRAA